MSDTPQGQLFSRVYLQRGDPTADSRRMRNRLRAALDLQNEDDLAQAVHRCLGVEVPSSFYGPLWSQFFSECKLRDLLDCITLIAQMKRQRSRMLFESWVKEVAQIFAEENVHYRIDELGGVHFAVDSEFEFVRASALAAIASDRYSNVRGQFEAAHSAMDGIPPDGKRAVRSIFSAIEGLFRLMFESAPRLAGDQVDKFVRPLIAKGDDRTANNSSGRWISSFKEWIEAAHFYRHEPGSEEPAQPPLSLAIALISSGAVHLRWLAELDQALNPQGPI